MPHNGVRRWSEYLPSDPAPRVTARIRARLADAGRDPSEASRVAAALLRAHRTYHTDGRQRGCLYCGPLPPTDPL